MDPTDDIRRLEPDEPLPAFGDVVGALFEDVVASVSEREGLEVESLAVDLPIELGVETDVVRCAPPTQYTAMSVMPVFHRLRLTLTPVRDLDLEPDLHSVNEPKAERGDAG